MRLKNGDDVYFHAGAMNHKMFHSMLETIVSILVLWSMAVLP